MFKPPHSYLYVSCLFRVSSALLSDFEPSEHAPSIPAQVDGPAHFAGGTPFRAILVRRELSPVPPRSSEILRPPRSAATSPQHTVNSIHGCFMNLQVRTRVLHIIQPKFECLDIVLCLLKPLGFKCARGVLVTDFLLQFLCVTLS